MCTAADRLLRNATSTHIRARSPLLNSVIPSHVDHRSK